jgi:hypothetical protein
MHLLLLNRLFILFVFLLLFKFNSLNLFESRHIGIKYLPLCGFERECGTLRRISFYTLLSKGKVESLRSSLLEIELVAE